MKCVSQEGLVSVVFEYLVFLCLWGLCIVVRCKIEEKGQESVSSLDL